LCVCLRERERGWFLGFFWKARTQWGLSQMGSVSIKDPGNTARTPQPPLKGPDNSPCKATWEHNNNPMRFPGKKKESIIHEGCVNPTYLTLSLRSPKQTSPIFIMFPKPLMSILYSLTRRHNHKSDITNDKTRD